MKKSSVYDENLKKSFKYNSIPGFGIILGGAFIAGCSIAAESKRELGSLRKTCYVVESANMPDSLDGKKICFFSDFHEAENGKLNNKILEFIDEENPEIVICGGDLINGKDNIRKFKPAVSLLNNISSKWITIYSIGNHERRLIDNVYGTKHVWNEFLKEIDKKIKILDNTSISFNNESEIIGLNLPLECYKRNGINGFSSCNIKKYIGNKNKNMYSILLAHDPKYMEAYLEWGADLVLSGHYHGGIVRIPKVGGIVSPHFSLFPEFDYGIKKIGNETAVITNGIGQHTIKIRIGNIPELVFICFRKGADA